MSELGCPEAKHYEAYDWCLLSDNVCIKNTGNALFDKPCGYSPDTYYCRECGEVFEATDNGYVDCPKCQATHFVFGNKEKEIMLF